MSGIRKGKKVNKGDSKGQQSNMVQELIQLFNELETGKRAYAEKCVMFSDELASGITGRPKAASY